MWSAQFLLLQCFFTIPSVLSDGPYECGEHGRFEYCIDEIPGCIIGCHCHPGYYFDTDTKICEPNAKLIEHHRRHYVSEPTRVPSFADTPDTMFAIDSVTTTNKIDGKVEEISKDANDLGDWLYNQFFKTIENQVINNTDDSDILTRRSGQPIKKPARRKKMRKGKGKPNQRAKKENIKKKILRITENDSLFDMTSGSDSDSTDSSSSDSSMEYDRHDSDNEHGHKKIVIFNKKPKPPLPNFIFLPNMDTPYYPPIGLPPPPVVPMYPIVPVPPVIPLCVTVENAKTTLTPTTTPAVTTPVVTTKIITTQAPTVQEAEVQTVTETPSESTTDQSSQLRYQNKKRKKGPRIHGTNGIVNNFGFNNLKPSSRQKILRLLKEKMGNPSEQLMSPWKNKRQKFEDTYMQNRDNEGSYFNNAPDDSYLRNTIQSKSPQGEITSENVDFKYITELIHKVDLKNNSNDLPPIEYNPLDSIEMYQPPMDQNQFDDFILPSNAPGTRRIYRPNKKQPDDLYYTKLGREIAAMIRGVDAQNKEINIKLEKTQDALKNDIFFNQNSPRSYWERFVRSPIMYLKSNKSKFEYLKRSNELLFDIENKVEIVASTRPTLTLQEIENIVNIMEAAKKDIQKKVPGKENVVPHANNLNVNLWPQEILENHKVGSYADSKLSNYNQTPHKQNPVINESNIRQTTDMPFYEHGIRMHDVHAPVAWRKPVIGRDIKTNNKLTDKKVNLKPDVNSYFPNANANFHENPSYEMANNKGKPLLNDNSRQSLLESNMDSYFLKHRKYFNHHGNFFDQFNQNFGFRQPQPSYFPQQVNHFGYIN